MGERAEPARRFGFLLMKQPRSLPARMQAVDKLGDCFHLCSQIGGLRHGRVVPLVDGVCGRVGRPGPKGGGDQRLSPGIPRSGEVEPPRAMRLRRWWVLQSLIRTGPRNSAGLRDFQTTQPARRGCREHARDNALLLMRIVVIII
jgi:hypothetical protein